MKFAAYHNDADLAKARLNNFHIWPLFPVVRTCIVKTRRTDRWHHLLAISCNEESIGLGGGWVAVHLPLSLQNINCSAGCLVLT